MGLAWHVWLKGPRVSLRIWIEWVEEHFVEGIEECEKFLTWHLRHFSILLGEGKELTWWLNVQLGDRKVDAQEEHWKKQLEHRTMGVMKGTNGMLSCCDWLNEREVVEWVQ
jgi:hypothetical protein